MLVGRKSNRNPHSLLAEVQNATILEDSLVVSYKHVLPYISAIKNLGIYSKKLKTYFYTKTCTWMFLATSFTVAKTWKRPRWLSIGEGMTKLSIPRQWNGILCWKQTVCQAIWWGSSLKCVLLNEESWSERATYSMTPTIEHSGKYKTMKKKDKVGELRR